MSVGQQPAACVTVCEPSPVARCASKAILFPSESARKSSVGKSSSKSEAQQAVALEHLLVCVIKQMIHQLRAAVNIGLNPGFHTTPSSFQRAAALPCALLARSLLTRPHRSEAAKAELAVQNHIPLNRPTVVGSERDYIEEVFENEKFGGGGTFSRRCDEWLTDSFGAPTLAVGSCTAALEMAALMCDLRSGDEVVVPSHAFPTTASAFARCGATLVFVEIDPLTMNVPA